MSAGKQIVKLRIVMLHPVAGVAFALQDGASGKAVLVPPASRTAEALAFDFEVAVSGSLPDGSPRFLGPCVQGPPTGRFVYLCVGQLAGQIDTEFSRRVKVPLGALTWEQITALPQGDRLTACIEGRGRDGTPVCATVPILPPGWHPS